MPKFNRETLAAIIALEILTQGVYFDSHSVWGLPVSKSLVKKTFHALDNAGVLRRSAARAKYLLTDSFLDTLQQEIARGMPRGNFVHYPDLAVFDVCGIQNWTEEELGTYVKRLRERWVLRTAIR